MFELNSKHGKVVVYAETIEQAAVSQIMEMANSPLGENAHIRIMPDAHAGKGCTIGTTMQITDKVCPNLVGVDIGCGVLLGWCNTDWSKRLRELDSVIREKIPSGTNVHEDDSIIRISFWVDHLRCLRKMGKDACSAIVNRADRSIGTLGGGNHFIEAYEGGKIAIHTGSRNLGVQVCKYYQDLAERKCSAPVLTRDEIEKIPPQQREKRIRELTEARKISKPLAYLTGQDLADYLHDMRMCQNFAYQNRKWILGTIERETGTKCNMLIDSKHNYIDFRHTDIINDPPRILRKGAISAESGEYCVIPLNMRDGIMVCRGKGNPEWNYSAPHGAGRLYSRSQAKHRFTLQEYAEAMRGVYTTCVNEATLDEAPFAYKNASEIQKAVEPTVDIVDVFTPVYNFKAG